jgi:hypothetical protein
MSAIDIVHYRASPNALHMAVASDGVFAVGSPVPKSDSSWRISRSI